MDIQIKDIRSGQKNLTVVFIVLDIGHPVITKENREVRSCKVADSTGCINVSVWDEPGQHLVPGDIMKLTRGYATYFRDSLTLYTGKTGDLQKIGEFCMVFNEQVNMSEPNPALAAQFTATSASTLLVSTNGPATNSGHSITNNGARQSVITPPPAALAAPASVKPGGRDTAPRYNSEGGNGGKTTASSRGGARGRGAGSNRNGSRERR